MKFSEETLMAYADDEVDAPTRRAIESAMAADPDIARRVARHKALRTTLRGAFDKVLEEPPPQRLLNAVRGAPTPRREGNVIPLRRKNQPKPSLPRWASLAASLVLGIIIGVALLHTSGSGGPVMARDGQLLANGLLAQALSDQLAGNQAADAPVKIGITFKAKSGDYCRTFTVHEAAGLAGYACREHEDWHVRMLTQGSAATTPNATHYRQAGAEVPAVVMQAVGEDIAGEPLDSPAEAAARQKNFAR